MNYYFYKAFLGEFPEVHDNLKDNFTSIDNDKVLTKYIYYLIKDKTKNFYQKGQQYPQFNFEMFNNFQIPLPPIQTQHQLLQQINQIEKENKELKGEIEALEQQKKEFLDKYLK